MRISTTTLLVGAVLLPGSLSAYPNDAGSRVQPAALGSIAETSIQASLTDTPPSAPSSLESNVSEIVSAPEFCPADALVIYWTSRYRQALVDLCLAVAADDRVICCVSSSSQLREAESALRTANVDLGRVEFLETKPATVWIRDYGPISTYRDGALSIADMRSPGRDVPIPVHLAMHEDLPWYQSLLVHAGGNHITDGNGMGFCSTSLLDSNPTWTIESIRTEFADQLGIDSLVVLPRLEGDVTGHCDMYVKLLSDTLFAVAKYAAPGDGTGNDATTLDELAEDLSTRRNLDGRRFEVVRLPMNPIVPGDYAINRSYTNSLIFNDKVLVPLYGTDLDQVALDIYTAAMPEYEVIGIHSNVTIGNSGAVHCISNEIRSTNPLRILHETTHRVAPGEAPVLRCRLAPRFSDCEVDLHYNVGDGNATETVPAVLSGGVWRAQMPPVEDGFDYWFVARAHTGADVLETTLPEAAPTEVFTVEASSCAAVRTHSAWVRALE